MSNQNLPDITTAFAVASGNLLRRKAAETFDVTEFSASDDEAVNRTFDQWSSHYKDLKTSEYGVACINLCRSVVVHYYAYCSPTKIDRAERIKFFASHWDQCELANGGIIEGKTSEDCIDLINENSSRYYARLGSTAASVMRTEFFNEFHKANWPLVPEYYKDVDYLSEQFVFVADPESNGDQFTAILYGLGSAMASHPNADEVGTENVLRWAVNRMVEIMEQFPEDKEAEGRF